MHPLVDAFYKGRSQLKKTTGKYFDPPSKPKKACDVGAIYYGLYNKTPRAGESVYGEIYLDYPEFSDKFVPIPCEHKDSPEFSDDARGYIGSILIHLNDEHTAHTWPDKKIAEWLEVALAS